MKKAPSRELYKNVVKNEQRKKHGSQSLSNLREAQEWQKAKREFLKQQNTFLNKLKAKFKK